MRAVSGELCRVGHAALQSPRGLINYPVQEALSRELSPKWMPSRPAAQGRGQLRRFMSQWLGEACAPMGAISCSSELGASVLLRDVSGLAGACTAWSLWPAAAQHVPGRRHLPQPWSSMLGEGLHTSAGRRAEACCCLLSACFPVSGSLSASGFFSVSFWVKTFRQRS